ncbi:MULTISPECIES: hypothetical protein [Trichocoleus]|uniref:Uncharacterized protein n=1 Tax=Trichocoleus desertorum GB2-A4 TaxID=2933944 RepID=A0ABV0JB30_9CYAN|nr:MULTISPECIES: hypothetical protein [unclassified Trichocoleus]MBD1863231.1 hypothetical protein [Trichocoleus sp. FACHB-46]MBD2120673.1 hypothetical protein [Trichocoleus sp. FACHB-262]
MSVYNLPLENSIERLREVRAALLRLHKALLEFERVNYEQFFGRIQSKGEYFQLVVNHDWFSWLRPISQFIVQIDEALSAKEPITVGAANELLSQARQMLRPAQDGRTTLEKRYYRAIQQEPEIALLHADVSQLLASASRPQ